MGLWVYLSNFREKKLSQNQLWSQKASKQVSAKQTTNLKEYRYRLLLFMLLAEPSLSKQFWGSKKTVGRKMSWGNVFIPNSKAQIILEFPRAIYTRSCKSREILFLKSWLLFSTWREYYYSQQTHFYSQPKKSGYKR